MYNDIHGKENHLIKLQGLPDNVPPAIDDEPEPVADAPKKRKRKQSKKARKAKKKARKLEPKSEDSGAAFLAEGFAEKAVYEGAISAE